MRVCTVCQQPVPAGMPVCPRDGAPADDPEGSGDLVGTMIGEYRLKGIIGEGGMGQVYEGIQPVIGKRVAIKLLRRELAGDPVEAERLLSEARSVNAIAHRGIIDIFSFGALPDGRQYFVMEYLSGLSLSQHIRKHGSLPVQDALKLLDEMLAALGAAHAAGVIHRDLKPSNIFLVTQPDGSAFVKVLDFGIAKQAPYSRGETPQTRVSRVMGTPEFMAPEQARGQPISPRTDIYALGVLTFQMLTGELPFDADNPFEIVNMHLNNQPPAPSELVREVPPEVDSLVLWMMEKDQVERPQTCEALREEVKRVRKSLQLDATQFKVIPTSMTQSLERPVEEVPAPAPVATPAPRSGPAGPTPAAEPASRRPRASKPNVETRLSPLSAEVPAAAAKETRIVSRELLKAKAAPAVQSTSLSIEVTDVEPPPRSLVAPIAGTSVLVALAVLVWWAPWRHAETPEPVAKTDLARVEPGDSETAKAETAKAETAKAETAKAETAKAEAAKAETAKAETAKAEAAKAEAEAAKADAAKAEAARAAAARAEAAKAEPAKADPLQGRYRRVKAAWAKARVGKSPEDTRIFDLMLTQVGKQVAAGERADAAATLNDFVQGALGGREP